MIANAPITFSVGDCASIPLPDDSADLVLTSPPYEDARTYGIDFSLSGQAWVDWAIPRVLECLRVSRGLVVWVVNGRAKNYAWSCTPFRLCCALQDQGIIVRKPPIYHRSGIPGSGGPDWLRDTYEFCLSFQKRPGRLPWSDNKAMGHPPKYGPGGDPTHRRKDGTRASIRRFKRDEKLSACTDKEARGSTQIESQTYVPPKIANPGNLIEEDADELIRCGPGGGGNIGSRLAHENEAPFPERLAEFFIRSFCPPNGLVVDPMCGSGTTGAVALRHGRSAWLMDIRESQFELAKKRCAQEPSPNET